MRSVEIVSGLSGIVVVGFCLFLIGLAVVIATKPSLAERFLRSFASSARAHYTEQGLRLLVGAAIVNFASSMWYSELFKLFGWLIVITTVGAIAVPMALAPQVRHAGDAACDPTHEVVCARGVRVGSVRPLRRVSWRKLMTMPSSTAACKPLRR